MPAPQPGPVINLLLILLFGVGGWFAGTLSKPPVKPRVEAPVQKGLIAGDASRGDFSADVRRFTAAEKAGGDDLANMIAAYGAGTQELTLLAGLIMEKWAVADAGGALSAGMPQCAAKAPDALPRAFAALAAKTAPAALLAALPQGPLRAECIATAAKAWGSAASEEALKLASGLSRQERTLFVREWHRGAPESAAPVLADADDRSAAVFGRMLALAVQDPQAAMLKAQGHDEFAAVAAAALKKWVQRNSSEAWQAAEKYLSHPRLAALTVALITGEAEQRSLSEMLPELQTLLARLHPDGPPEEVLRVFIPALAAERPLSASKYIDSLPGGAASDAAHTATVILYDALCKVDPAAAWRLSNSLLQAQGAKDHRTVQPWPSPAAHAAAGALDRWKAGFPCAADMTALLQHWMRTAPEAALNTFLTSGLPEALQSAALEVAVSPYGGGMPPETLTGWARKQSPAVELTVENLLNSIRR